MSILKTYACILLSAWLYAMPALFNDYFWWISFIFLLPFLYGAVQHNLSFAHLYVWALCANAFHLSGVLIGIISIAEPPVWKACLPSFFAVAYAALFGLTIVVTARVCQDYVFSTLKTKKIWSYCVGFWVYFLLMDHVSMCIFDTVEGYFLLHPVLPLAKYPALIRLLPWLHSEGLCIVLLTTQAAFFATMYEKTGYWKKLFSGCLLFWFVCFLIPVQKLVQPSWFNKVVAVPYVFKSKPSVESMFQLAVLFLKDAACSFQDATIFVMPEASFFCETLADNTALNQLNICSAEKSIHLLTGSFAWEDAQYRNTLYWLHNAKLKAQFHKTHAMVLTERMPSLFRSDLMNGLYFKNFNEIIPSPNARPVLEVIDDFAVVPYICSELFFAKRPRDDFTKHMIYALCNDRWTVDYVKLLMLRVAQYKAIEWQRPIVYVSFAYQCYIDTAGTMMPLQRYVASSKFLIQ